MNPALLRSHLYEELVTCESTQDEARLRLNESNHQQDQLHWIVTKEQTRGRGRQSSKWLTHSQAEAQLITSVAFKNSALDRLGSLISLVAGHALYRAVQNLIVAAVPLNEHLFLKWPNDLYVTENSGELAKIGGILCERSAKLGTVVGFGVNLLWSPEIEDRKSSHLHRFVPHVAPEALRLNLLQELIKEFQLSLEEFLNEPEIYPAKLCKSLRHTSMKIFFDLPKIIVNQKEVKPLELAKDGTLLALDFSTGQQVVLR
jgi:biotin-(acetyl-CoA carboxylase) ligase